MGFADRDYNRAPQRRAPSGAFGSLPMWSISTWIIAINVAVFLIDQMTVRRTWWGQTFPGVLTQWGAFSKYTALNQLQLWRFISFQFLHANVTHILFNMLSLYFFGPMIEQYLGSRRFVAFYLLCGAAGAVMYLILWAVGFLESANAPLVGASAGIFGVLIAAAQVAPNSTVMLMFPPIPLRLRTLAWIMIGIAVVTIITSGHNAGGEAAHLGGAALGYLLIRQPQWLNFLDMHRRKPRFFDHR